MDAGTPKELEQVEPSAPGDPHARYVKLDFSSPLERFVEVATSLAALGLLVGLLLVIGSLNDRGGPDLAESLRSLGALVAFGGGVALLDRLVDNFYILDRRDRMLFYQRRIGPWRQLARRSRERGFIAVTIAGQLHHPAGQRVGSWSYRVVAVDRQGHVVTLGEETPRDWRSLEADAHRWAELLGCRLEPCRPQRCLRVRGWGRQRRLEFYVPGSSISRMAATLAGLL